MNGNNNWQKATASNLGGGCVELADLGVAMRDSKDPDGPQLYFSRREIAAFLIGARMGEFDHLVDAVDWTEWS